MCVSLTKLCFRTVFQKTSSRTALLSTPEEQVKNQLKKSCHICHGAHSGEERKHRDEGNLKITVFNVDKAGQDKNTGSNE